MSGPELKPCPFCGGYAASGEWEDGGGDRWAGVCCTDCLAEIQLPVDFHAATSDGQIAEVIAAWNTRAPVDYAALPEVQALIAEAVAKEREACARMVDCGCDKGQKAAVIDAENGADRARACGQYNCGAEDAAAIRKRGEGKGAALDAIENGPFPASWWTEADGDVLWWCWRDGEWLAEAPYVGSPLCMGYTVELHARDAQHHMHRMHIGGWPGYHTHWTRLPPQPPAPRTFL